MDEAVNKPLEAEEDSSSSIESSEPKAKKALAIQEGSMFQTVVKLAWPVIVEMMLITIVGIVDMAMVGKLGPSAIAAVGLGMQLVMFPNVAFAGIRTGTTALVARHIGAREPEEAHVIARQSIVLSLILAAVTFVLFYPFPAVGFKLLGAEPDVVALGTGYLQWRTIGLIFSFVTMTIVGMLRGCGDTKTSMYVNVIINILNPAFNYIFIFGHFGAPKMGASGAGFATMLAQLVGAVVIICVITSGKKMITLRFTDNYRLQRKPIRRLLNIGLPAMAESLAMRLAQFGFTMILTSLGTAVYAAHQIAIRAESLSFMPGWGFGVAATTLVGQSLGAKRPDLAEKSGYMSRNIAVAVQSFMGVLFFLFPTQFVRIFTDDAAVIAQAAQVLRLIAIAQPALAINMVLAGGLRGAGDTRWVTYITASSVWIIRLGIAAFCVYVLHMGLFGAWIGMTVDLIVRAIMFSIRFALGKWKELEV